MEITQLVVDVFADQLQSYVRNHPLFNFKPPDNSCSLSSSIAHVAVDFLLKLYVFGHSLLLGREVECPICFDSEDLTIFLPCCHIICAPCCRRWYEDKIDRGATCSSLTCASPACTSGLSLLNCKKIFFEEARLKMKFNYYLSVVARISEDNKAACPQPDCRGYFLRFHTDPSSPDYDEDTVFATCPLCFINNRVSVYCFKCRKHHTKEEHNCLGNLLVYKTNKVLKNWFGVSFEKKTDCEILIQDMKLITKKCPSCGIPCEKDEACNRCTCLNCGVEFNWAHERLWEGYTEEFRRNTVFN